jgi:hypothetical protein
MLSSLAAHVCAAGGPAAKAEAAPVYRKNVCGIEATLLRRAGRAAGGAGGALRVTPLPAPIKLGAEVLGLDIKSVDWAAEPALAERLRAALHEHGLLLIPSQHGLPVDAQVAFGRAMAGGRPIMVADNYSVRPQRPLGSCAAALRIVPGSSGSNCS